MRVFQAKVHDIEELGGVGKRLGACPYYGTRKAARLAEVSRFSPPAKQRWWLNARLHSLS